MLATLSSLPLTSSMANRSSTTQPSVSHSRRRGRLATDSLAWIFRTNLPPRKGSPLAPVEKRNFFGFGDILSVLANPGETLRSLTEAREALKKARRELEQQTTQLPTSHLYCFGTPKSLPSSSGCSFPRPAELNALRRILDGPPSFTILCGASSVGKTALLRDVLCDKEKYRVLRLDLRIAGAGIADLEGLYSRLSGELQAFFGILSETTGSHEVLFKETSVDKCDRVKASDVALLMERFRTALLRYHCACDPSLSTKGATPEKVGEDRDALSDEETRVGHAHDHKTRKESGESTLERSVEKATVLSEPSGNEAGEMKEESDKGLGEKTDDRAEKPTTSGAHFRPPKPMPVIIFDDACRLPELVRSSEMQEAMQSLLDVMLVLSKQDGLCHVVHVTNDGLYVDWLRRMGVVEPCKIITISDFSKVETQQHFIERLLPSVPATLRSRLDKDVFEHLFNAFGGRLAHWTDFVLCDWVNAGGNLSVERSTQFLQSYTLLNLQLLHASESDLDVLQDDDYEQQADLEREKKHRQRGCHHCGAGPGPDYVDPRPKSRSRRWSGWSWSRVKGQESRTHLPTGSKRGGGDEKPAFTSMQLLDVMHRLSSSSSRFSSTHQGRPNVSTDTIHGGIETITDTVAERGVKTFAKDAGGCAFIGYFALCREIGKWAVDDMVRARILELRWSEAIQPSSGFSSSFGSSSLRDMFDHSHASVADNGVEPGGLKGMGLGPTIHPISPIMAYAMRVVLDEYEYQPAHEVLEEEEEHGEMEEEYEDDIPEGGRDGRRGYDIYEEESDGGQEHGGESSGLSDDKSDYVSLSDVSEY